MPTPSPKETIRRRLRESLRVLDAADRAAQSGQICELLLPLASKGSKVLAFWPLSSEPDIRPALERWLAEGVTICLPQVQGEGMVPRAVSDFDTLIKSDHGVREPHPEHSNPASADELALVIVPGLGFTANGERLGRGGGFYDRFLAGLPRSVATVGIAFDVQLVDTLPTEPHDQQVGRVIVPK